MNDNIIQVKGLKKHYFGGEVKALDGIDTEIRRGEVVVVIGPSGSGKSTFLRSLNLLEIPTDGQILFNGVDITDKKANINLHRQKMGMVFQHFNLFVNMNILKNMTIAPTQLLKKSKKDAEEKARALLKRVGLEDRANAYPSQLSGGQKQRVAIAGIMAMQTDCIVLDEPTAMLDPKGREEVINSMLYLNKEMGITVVLITHYMDEAVKADRVIVMDSGNVVLDGTPAEVFAKEEIIEKAGLELPDSAKLANILRRNGVALPEGILTPDDFINSFKTIVSGGAAL